MLSAQLSIARKPFANHSETLGELDETIFSKALSDLAQSIAAGDGNQNTGSLGKRGTKTLARIGNWL